MRGVERIHEAFARARDEGRAALIIYLPAGFPDMPTSLRCLEAAAEAGADLLEVGFPFSDPIMDGPTIQHATQRALEQGYRVDDDLAMSAELSRRVDVPALVMTYYTLVDTRGLDRFAADAAAAGLVGAIIPDLPADEGDPWCAAAARHGLGTVFLAASVSSDDRLERIAAASTGFVYATGLLGVTGVRTVTEEARGLVERLRRYSTVPVAVGVGVRDPEHAAEVAGYADGVIVGSAAVEAAGAGDPAGAPERVAELVRRLRAAVVTSRA